MDYCEACKLLKNVPNLNDKLDKIIEIYNLDISTPRKKTNKRRKVFNKIVDFMMKRYIEGETDNLENFDLFNWAVGYIDFNN